MNHELLRTLDYDAKSVLVSQYKKIVDLEQEVIRMNGKMNGKIDTSHQKFAYD